MKRKILNVSMLGSMEKLEVIKRYYQKKGETPHVHLNFKELGILFDKQIRFKRAQKVL